MPKKAILFMIISALAFTLMNITAKKMAHYSPFQMVFFRSLGTLVFTSSYLVYNKINYWGTHKKLLFFRSIAGMTSMLLFFTSLSYLPVGTAVTLRYLSPIFAAIFSVFLIKEKIVPIRWLFFILAFVGVLILKLTDLQFNIIGLVVIIGSAVCGGLVYNSIKLIGDKEHPYTIVNHFMLLCTLVGGMVSIFHWKPIQSEDYIPLLSIGLYGYVGQLNMTKAFQLGEINKVAPIKYTEAIFTLLIGISFFGDSYSLWSLIGMGLIITALLLNLLFKPKGS
ncbi:DMT family transporter [Mangrovimonas sp. AS39]|uniref:DMT family transporter n=1 Tax=Mangrovimonas futianensis TaxID=2895523 RepID=UPI001E54AD01|nr:DMT family transporter [Mangrovimonas futianensis]MCF1191270.1 DMT family transporter [Mangrovimonas futianensis]MCF1194965.1 DMT family transporter [Mangrovimonas futianensis]